MLVQFEIESVFKITNRGYFVSARHLIPEQNFLITDKSFLGGVELNKYLDVPRAINDKGEQRSDLFAFHLKNDEDRTKLTPMTIVALIPGNSIHYLKPWHSANIDLSVQLHREINIKHILYGKEVITIARRQDNDDVLFELEGADFKYAMVHLTWAQQTLKDSKYPTTIFYKDWQDVYENRILVDHKGWENE
jgi:hypothetical protein